MTVKNERELATEVDNPMGMDGIEFIEYATTKPQALGQLLEAMGFHPIARHRSREVLLYRQGGLNVIVNAHDAGQGVWPWPEDPVISAVAFRVRDAGAAYRRALLRGAWALPTHVEVMELNIPAIHGVGKSRIYFVDRYEKFSIYDVDFVPIQSADPHPPALTDMRLFGMVQYVGFERTEDWTEFYGELFGFTAEPEGTRYGILPKGRLLKSPCKTFHLQLVEPDYDSADMKGEETLARIGLGTPNVLVSVAALRKRGVEFVESQGVHSEARGALTTGQLSSVMFELVHDDEAGAA